VDVLLLVIAVSVGAYALHWKRELRRQLQVSREQHRVLLDTLPGLVWSAKPDGSNDYTNQRFVEYTGFSQEEVKGWKWTDTDGLHPEDLPRLLDAWRTVVATGEPVDLEARLRRFDRTYRWFVFRVAPLRDHAGQVLAWWGLGVDIDDHKRAVEAALRAQFEATLTERTRLASELHDTLLQGFTGVTLEIQGVLQRALSDAPREAADLSRVLALADTTLREAREMIWDMRAPVLEGHDLATALEAAARRALGGTSIELRFTVRGERRPLPPEIDTAALRIGREAVVNARKHAGPSVVGVDLLYEPRSIQLSVQDDGAGFVPREADGAGGGGHWGVVGMRERASRAGGTLEITSETGRGTTVTLRVPAAPDA